MNATPQGGDAFADISEMDRAAAAVRLTRIAEAFNGLNIRAVSRDLGLSVQAAYRMLGAVGAAATAASRFPPRSEPDEPLACGSTPRVPRPHSPCGAAAVCEGS